MEFLSQQGVEFVEKNIQEDEQAMQELVRLGSQSTPTIVVGEEVMVGFDGDRLLSMLKDDEEGGGH